jgi:hypothetical protein
MLIAAAAYRGIGSGEAASRCEVPGVLAGFAKSMQEFDFKKVS